jgi:DMSO reductase family type II enzyme molybdopterin subunit
VSDTPVSSIARPGNFSTLDPGARIDEVLSRPYEYRGWEDVYRDEWTWDDVVHVSHLRTNCISTCSLDAYVKDGIVWREEQNANYPQEFPDIPDFNPRGCPGGCAYSTQMYDPTRIRYPMKRVGERGSGRWKRLSWDEAFEEIADKLIDVITEDGSDCIVYDQGTTNIDNGIGSMMEMHFFGSCLSTTSIDSWAGVGDLPVGLIQSWGTYMSEGTADDWFRSDYILIWIANPSYTRVPDAHFLWEARYRGAKVVSIAPDFSPSTVHADHWLNVRYGTDAALALGMVHTILEEDLHDVEYVKEQTDLPFLVRDDNGRFLRECDVVEGGAEDQFYLWNATTDSMVLAAGTWGSDVMTLELGDDTDPALEGAHEVRLADGKSVRVRPVFELLRAHIAEYPPARAAEITGVPEANIRRVARELAAAKSSMIFSSWGACKHYHSDLFQRGMVYLMALTGNSGGKPGAGIKVSTWWPMPGFVMGSFTARLPTGPPEPMPTDRAQMQDITKEVFALTKAVDKRSTPLIPWLYAHDPKFAEIAGRDAYSDPALPRPVSEYMNDIFEREWQPIRPKPPKRPKFLYYSGPNPLRRWPNAKAIRDSLWKSIDTIVTTDFRMSTSGMWSDYILPACGYYEKPGIKYVMSYIPYVCVGDRAVEPLFESKHEWDIMLGLARKIQDRARARGIDSFTDLGGNERTLSNLYDELSADGVYVEGEKGERAALDYIMTHSPITRATDLGEQPWQKAVEDGMVKIEKIDPIYLGMGLSGVMSDFDYSEPMNQFGWFIKQKNPWPTLTGRQQFYIDHEWFLEVGEQLVVHKEPLPAGGAYPLRLTGGHTRWSQHAIFRANQQLLRLQRGGPVAYISVADARERGISDHDQIRVYNDVGEFVLRAKLSPAVQPGEVICYHAWEGYQFPGGANQNHVAPSPLKPTNMVGDYGHLQYRGAFLSMNNVCKEIAVEIEKLREEL